MNDNQILLLGLGLEAPWKLVDQKLDTSKHPHDLRLTIQAERVANTLATAAEGHGNVIPTPPSAR